MMNKKNKKRNERNINGADVISIPEQQDMDLTIKQITVVKRKQ